MQIPAYCGDLLFSGKIYAILEERGDRYGRSD